MDNFRADSAKVCKIAESNINSQNLAQNQIIAWQNSQNLNPTP
ncbi:hypothetical protein [Helicobacter sp. 23-1045]